MSHAVSAVILVACALAWSGEAPYTERREAMAARLSAYDPEHPVKDPRVLSAMREVPRHMFVPKDKASEAYEERELSIGKGQTISQPFHVAYMTQVLEPKDSDRVLEIGTGSGYQAAVLSRLAKEVYTIEIETSLARKAEKVLKELGYINVFVRAGDGYRGWPEKAPFDAIIVTCPPDHIPAPLVEQLSVGGRLVIPVGVEKGKKETHQTLVVVRKTDSGLVEEKRLGMRLRIPMKGEAARKRGRR